MAVNWTPAQRQVIDAEGKTLLVSAAAGSGKTAVLTARIIERLTAPGSEADLSRMLIVTFTKAAAAELKERIAAALQSRLAESPTNARIKNQLMRLERAHISTIHSFCYDVVRGNFEKLGISAAARVAEPGEMAILRRDVMDQTVEEYYNLAPESCDIADFPAFCENFITVQDEKLCDVMLALYEKLSVYPEGIGFLLKERESPEEFLEGSFGSLIRREMDGMLAHFEKIYADACEYFDDGGVFAKNYLPAFSADLADIRALRDALAQGYDGCRAALQDYSRVSLGRGVKAAMQTDESLFFKEARDDYASERTRFAESFFSLKKEEIREAEERNRQLFADVYRLLSAYERRMDGEKRERGILDFNDLERLTYRLLYDENGALTPSAAELSARFDEVYIDEYQDVNALQDRIFAAVSRPDNRIMVGDIKQSIYGFRGASPEIFAGYRKRFPSYAPDSPDKAGTIFLSHNFRCDRPVIDFCNRVCGMLFRQGDELIPYGDEDDLVLGKSDGGDAPVEVALLPKSEEEGENAEAAYVCARIGELVRSGVRPGDICILMRSVKDRTEPFEAGLKQLSLPSENSVARDFFGNAEVLLMLCLLNCIDNPTRDIYLAGALKSPLYGFTLDDLVRVRRHQKEGALIDALRGYTEETGFAAGRYFLEKLAQYRKAAEGLSVDKLIWLIYRDSGLLGLVYEGEGNVPKTRRANLMLLYQYARSFEGGSFRGLYKFIQYINNLLESGEKIKGADSGADAGSAVRIMSVHQSKGLEFPVCFLCGTAKKFNLRDASDPVLFTRDTAAAAKMRHESGFAFYDTPMRRAAGAAMKREMIQEEMRVLYVALTRAKNRLFVTACDKEPEKLLEHCASGAQYWTAYSLCRSGSFIEWILSALHGGSSDAFCRISIGGETEFPEKEKAGAIAPASEQHDSVGAELPEIMRERFSFVYPGAALTAVPAKLSVSALNPAVLDDEEDGAHLESDAPRLKAKPRFLEDRAQAAYASPSERGTATHVFMQFCDYRSVLRDGVEAELSRMREQGFMTDAMADMCYREQLRRFFAGPLCAEILASKKVWREIRFNIHLPAEDFTGSEEKKKQFSGEQILVQGVVDCLYLDRAGKLCLVDYKTDYIPPELRGDSAAASAMLLARHSRQLEYYRIACERMLRMPVERVWLYSFGMGEAYAL